MKKFLALAAAGVLCFSAVSCGKKDGEGLIGEPLEELEKPAEEGEDEVIEEPDEPGEDTEETVKKYIPDVNVPADIAALGYDTGLEMSFHYLMYLPYSSDLFDYHDDYDMIKNDKATISACVYDSEDTLRDSIKSAKTYYVEEYDGEYEEITIGGYDVLVSTYNALGWETEYYVDFGGAFGNIPGAYISVSANYGGNKEDTIIPEIEDMIANIFMAEE